ncbi:hypothetical protein NIES4101_69410 [Calothrix sp. NIES-4101]|nr:hypothetical protein NIES4101_69410 [Calothrix sp. NIES-4101]
MLYYFLSVILQVSQTNASKILLPNPGKSLSTARMSGVIDFFHISLDNLKILSVKMEIVPYSKLQNLKQQIYIAVLIQVQILGTLFTCNS